MTKITLYHQRKVNSITVICDNVETYQTCNLVISGTITIDLFSNDS